MPVEAVLVVGHHDLRLVGAHEVGQPARRLLDRGAPEAAGRVVLRPALHPRVVVAEQLQVRDAEDLATGLQLTAAQRDDDALVVAGVARLEPAGRVAQLTVRAGDEHGTYALSAVAGQDAARADGLVVGVGVHGHEGEGSVRHAKQRMGRRGRADRVRPPKLKSSLEAAGETGRGPLTCPPVEIGEPRRFDGAARRAGRELPLVGVGEVDERGDQVRRRGEGATREAVAEDQLVCRHLRRLDLRVERTAVTRGVEVDECFGLSADDGRQRRSLRHGHEMRRKAVRAVGRVGQRRQRELPRATPPTHQPLGPHQVAEEVAEQVGGGGRPVVSQEHEHRLAGAEAVRHVCRSPTASASLSSSPAILPAAPSGAR